MYFSSLTHESRTANFQAVSALRTNPNTVVVCGDQDLTSGGSIGANVAFFDRSRANTRVLLSPGLPGRSNACGGNKRAFEYDAFNGQRVVLLCTDGQRSAIGSTIGRSEDASTRDTHIIISRERWRRLDLAAFSNVANPSGNPTGLDIFGFWLSYMILHELLHAANSLLCKPFFASMGNSRTMCVGSLTKENCSSCSAQQSTRTLRLLGYHWTQSGSDSRSSDQRTGGGNAPGERGLVRPPRMRLVLAKVPVDERNRGIHTCWKSVEGT